MPLKPIRKIKPSSRSITGKYSSAKTQSVHQFESSLERDFLTLLEFDDTVQDYGVQPLAIYYKHNRKTVRYTPDMVVHYMPALSKKPLLCEIKYEAELQGRREYYEPKFRAATEYGLINNYQFKIFTEKDIRTDYLVNVNFLSRYSRTAIDEKYLKIITAWLLQNPACTPKELLVFSTTEENARVLYTVWQMLAGRLIKCDMKTKLTMTSMIWKSQD